MKRIAIAALLTTITLAACTQSPDARSDPRPRAATGPLTEKHFGTTADGQPVEQFTLTNTKGSSARFISYGAILTNLFVPDKNNHLGDVVLGYDSVKEYELSIPSMCCIVGRFANRIGNATFKINDFDPAVKVPSIHLPHITANQRPQHPPRRLQRPRQTHVES